MHRIPEPCLCGDPWCKRCFPYGGDDIEYDADEDVEEGSEGDTPDECVE